jgi:hypothetical protein
MRVRILRWQGNVIVWLSNPELDQSCIIAKYTLAMDDLRDLLENLEECKDPDCALLKKDAKKLKKKADLLLKKVSTFADELEEEVCNMFSEYYTPKGDKEND